MKIIVLLILFIFLNGCLASKKPHQYPKKQNNNSSNENQHEQVDTSKPCSEELVSIKNISMSETSKALSEIDLVKNSKSCKDLRSYKDFAQLIPRVALQNQAKKFEKKVKIENGEAYLKVLSLSKYNFKKIVKKCDKVKTIESECNFPKDILVSSTIVNFNHPRSLKRFVDPLPVVENRNRIDASGGVFWQVNPVFGNQVIGENDDISIYWWPTKLSYVSQENLKQEIIGSDNYKQNYEPANILFHDIGESHKDNPCFIRGIQLDKGIELNQEAFIHFDKDGCRSKQKLISGYVENHENLSALQLYATSENLNIFRLEGGYLRQGIDEKYFKCVSYNSRHNNSCEKKYGHFIHKTFSDIYDFNLGIQLVLFWYDDIAEKPVEAHFYIDSENGIVEKIGSIYLDSSDHSVPSQFFEN